MSTPRHGAPRRRRHSQESEEEEALWIYSYADLLSLILCFFIILYSMASKNKGRDANEVVKKVIETFSRTDSTKIASAEVGIRSQSREVRAMHLLLAALNLEDKEAMVLKSLDQMANGDQDIAAAKAIISEELKKAGAGADERKQLANALPKASVDIILPSATLFRRGSDELTPEALRRLESISLALAKIPALTQIHITGHTNRDSYRSSRYPNNWALSAARAGVVAQALIRNGIDEKLLLVGGLGELRPLVQNQNVYQPNGSLRTQTPSRTDFDKNERVEITVRKPL